MWLPHWYLSEPISFSWLFVFFIFPFGFAQSDAHSLLFASDVEVRVPFPGPIPDTHSLKEGHMAHSFRACSPQPAPQQDHHGRTAWSKAASFLLMRKQSEGAVPEQSGSRKKPQRHTPMTTQAYLVQAWPILQGLPSQSS